MVDNEINKIIFNKIKTSPKLSKMNEKIILLDIGEDEIDFCNSPSLTWEIIEAYWEEINSFITFNGIKINLWNHCINVFKCSKLKGALIAIITYSEKNKKQDDFEEVLNEIIMNNLPMVCCQTQSTHQEIARYITKKIKEEFYFVKKALSNQS